MQCSQAAGSHDSCCGVLCRPTCNSAPRKFREELRGAGRPSVPPSGRCEGGSAEGCSGQWSRLSGAEAVSSPGLFGQCRCVLGQLQFPESRKGQQAHATEIYFQRGSTPHSYCLHLFSAQEAEQGPTCTWDHMPALTPAPRPGNTVKC